MTEPSRIDAFPAFAEFARVSEPGLYAPLPDDWFLGLTDVVRSTGAIAKGQYKAVNVAGSAAISGIMNHFATRHFPFAFGGDGSVFALPAADEAGARDVLARTAAWARDDLGLTLRAAIVPVAAVRAAGRDVRVALFRPSPHVSYAMFDGGGVAFAEAEMKAGRHHVDAAAPGARPDLSGLSCRWQPIAPRNGAMVSLIVVPGRAGEAAFHEATRRVIDTLGDPGRFNPVDETTLRPALLSRGLWLEALASRNARARLRALLGVAAHNALGWALFTSRLKAGRFNPSTYRAIAAENADYRKFDDALYVIADCDPALEGEVMALLAAEEDAGRILYGTHRQDAALMTCIVPSFQDNEHFHFIDGAGGGYAAAAASLRAKRGG
ncbi:DUF3095 domain-containing protein [Acuticoccus yangtzensis]|uniref:DUF3095 domain-containing protein n=1 Tax=Acuticoccus yangtzensis TaxID=1443441 RepID=UPI00094962C1|nr:DUF3095 domain-containing protein [Acuticoccus yangtzensis]